MRGIANIEILDIDAAYGISSQECTVKIKTTAFYPFLLVLSLKGQEIAGILRKKTATILLIVSTIHSFLNMRPF
jgi:hypothetical protein